MFIIRRWLPYLAVALLWFGPQQAMAATLDQTRTTVMFVGGYASTLAGAAHSFAPLRTALQAQRTDLSFVQFSYTGWNAETCTPLEYRATDTGQDFESSKRILLETIYTLRTRCGVDHIIIIGHSLGGLVALHALADNPMREVVEVVTIDSPLGGTPVAGIGACGDSSLCVDGPVTRVLSGLYANWDQTALENAARVGKLSADGIRVTAWGNGSDCLYAPGVCLPFASAALRRYDVPETQWLGIDHALRRDFMTQNTLQSVLGSHEALLSGAADEIAREVMA